MAFQVQTEHKALPEPRERKGPPDLPASMARQGRKAQLARQDRKAQLARQGRKAQQAPRATQVRPAPWVHKDPSG